MAMSAKDLLQFLRDAVQGLQPDQGIDTAALLKVLNDWEAEHARKETAQKVEALRLSQAQETHFKIMALMVDKGSAYANLIILAGYAAYFALLPLVKDLLSSDERRASGLLMFASLAAFVGFEVFKMMFMQFSTMWRYRRFSRESKQSGFDYFEASAALERDLNRLQTRFIPGWLILTTIAVLSGGAAILIPAVAFVQSLVG